MGWKERLKPRNKAEAGCMTVFLAAPILLAAGLLAGITGINFLGIVAVAVIAYYVTQLVDTDKEIYETYQISRRKATVVTVLAHFILLSLLVLAYSGWKSLMALLPIEFAFIAWLLGVLALVRYWKPIRTFVFELVLQHLFSLSPNPTGHPQTEQHG